MSEAETSTIIGIDLGTTNCCAAFYKNNVVQIITNAKEERTIPSYVAFKSRDNVVFGNEAKKHAIVENVIYDTKRLIGRQFDDPIVQNDIKTWPFTVESDSNNKPCIIIDYEKDVDTFNPENISAMILKSIRLMADKYFKTKKVVKDAVITVPAYFNYQQRKATENAGKKAGLNVLRIINEPTAAALAYVHKNKISEKKNILVYDLGGGTLDVSIISVEGESVRVLSTCGNTHLGGRDFDECIKNWIIPKIVKNKLDKRRERNLAMRRILQECEAVKIRLSSAESTCFILDSFQGQNLEIKITRTDLEKICSTLFDKVMKPVQNCLNDSGLNKDEIHDIVLVGGSSRIPHVQNLLSKFFTGRKLSKTVNPDEAVAYGAAIQAAILDNNSKSNLKLDISDVTPLSLGVGTAGGIMSVIIPRNTSIPVSKTEKFTTNNDKQTDVPINIYEGERPLIKHNTKLGTCTVMLPPKPIGYPFDITLHVNGNGILEVSMSHQSNLYSKVAIEYEKHTAEKASDIIDEAETNKCEDARLTDISRKLTNLRFYFTKVMAVCEYDQRDMTDFEKQILKDFARDQQKFLDKEGGTNFVNVRLEDIEEINLGIEEVCEPILTKYEYYIRDMNDKDFHKMISK